MVNVMIVRSRWTQGTSFLLAGYLYTLLELITHFGMTSNIKYHNKYAHLIQFWKWDYDPVHDVCPTRSSTSKTRIKVCKSYIICRWCIRILRYVFFSKQKWIYRLNITLRSKMTSIVLHEKNVSMLQVELNHTQRSKVSQISLTWQIKMTDKWCNMLRKESTCVGDTSPKTDVW